MTRPDLAATPPGLDSSGVSDDTTYRISDGVILAPFTDSAVAVDLATDKAHVLSRAAAWLLSQESPVTIDDLVAAAPAAERDELRESILDTIDTLRTPGLVERDEPFDWPVPFADGGGPQPGAHIGATHAVIDRRIAFRSDDAELLERVDAMLGDAVDEPATRFFDLTPDAETGGIRLYAADEWVFPTEDRLLWQLPTVLNDDGSHTHAVAVVHCGVVRTPDGRVIMMAAPPNAGKSTLTGALVAAGCDYLGDESVGITLEGTVLGYPKPLTLSPTSRQVLGLGGVDFPHARAAELRADVDLVAEAAGIDEILLVRYDPTHTGMMSGRPLEPVPALEAMLGNVLNLSRAGEQGLEAICNLVESVPVVPFTHPGVDEAVPVILGN